MRLILLFWLIIMTPWAWHASAAGNAGASAGPNADSTPAGQGAATPPAPDTCPERPPLARGVPSAIIVQLDPDTLWRPRGSEVRFTVRSPGGATFIITNVRVCFGWSSADANFRNSQPLIGSPQVRSISNDTGALTYGAVVPTLPRIPNSDFWPWRLFSSMPYIFTGVFTVPVADMVVEITTPSGPLPVVTATQVGITEVIVAWVVVGVVTALVWLVMDRIARARGIRGRNLLLRVISTRDGYASLSQMQIVLWTMVVGASAIYVMTLSGNLINISDGTLVLLGIASAAALAARIPTAAPSEGTTPIPLETTTMPEWSDLFIPDRTTREIDVTRLQMLAFTLITAAFVLIKVAVDYEIPTIPANFLLLMGISNGVYMGGRHLPSLPKNPGG